MVIRLSHRSWLSWNGKVGVVSAKMVVVIDRERNKLRPVRFSGHLYVSVRRAGSLNMAKIAY